MAVLEIQANGDTVVSKEAITNTAQSLEDPLIKASRTGVVGIRNDGGVPKVSHFPQGKTWLLSY